MMPIFISPPQMKSKRFFCDKIKNYCSAIHEGSCYATGRAVAGGEYHVFNIN